MRNFWKWYVGSLEDVNAVGISLILVSLIAFVVWVELCLRSGLFLVVPFVIVALSYFDMGWGDNDAD